MTNNLCCELNMKIHCLGCGKKWCDPCANKQENKGGRLRGWTSKDFDHHQIGESSSYACPIVDTVRVVKSDSYPVFLK